MRRRVVRIAVAVVSEPATLDDPPLLVTDGYI